MRGWINKRCGGGGKASARALFRLTSGNDINISRVVMSIQNMFAGIADRYDLANDILSLGIHRLWKRSLVNFIHEKHVGRYIDICTGTGDLLPIIGKRCNEVVGVDFCLPMLLKGKKRGFVQNTSLLHADALHLPFASEQFDLVTVAYGVRNIPKLKEALAEMQRVMKPGAQLIVLEFGQPETFLISDLYRFYSRWVLPVVGGIVSGDIPAFRYLCDSSAAFPCGERFREILEAEGFAVDLVKPLSFGISYVYSARRL